MRELDAGIDGAFGRQRDISVAICRREKIREIGKRREESEEQDINPSCYNAG
jgi:hypothetical protein